MMNNACRKNLDFESMIKTECFICIQKFCEGDEISYSQNSNCCHHFHKSCIINWLARNQRCPACRRNYLKNMKHDEEEGLENVSSNDDVLDNEENQTMEQDQSFTNNNYNSNHLDESTTIHEDEEYTETAVLNLNSDANDDHIHFPISISTS